MHALPCSRWPLRNSLKLVAEQKDNLLFRVFQLSLRSRLRVFFQPFVTVFSVFMLKYAIDT